MTTEEYNALLTILNTIKNETQQGANTAYRVGSALVSIANQLKGTDDKFDGLRLWHGTQAEYDRMTHYSDVVYIIK